MDELIKQAPENITYNDLEIIFLRNNKNIVDTLAEVWNIPVNNINNNDNKDKWKMIRETYDEIDKEMYNVIKNSKK
jgi:hypothetical protein